MGSITDDDEIVEDRFDDQSFDDAPLSDHESNFDEMELRECDEIHQPTDKICSRDNWIRPALSTIPEESKIEDIPSRELTIRSSVSRYPLDNSTTNNDESSIRALSIKSSEFIADQKASDIIQREQESFFRGHGRFIQDDPRFNKSHFEKENSWEPSILDHSSFENTTKSNIPLLKEVDVCAQKSTQECLGGGTLGERNDNTALIHARTYGQKIIGKEIVSSDATSEQCDRETMDVEKLTLSHIRTTPKRVLSPPSVTNESPNPSDSSSSVVQTSTPISLIAKATSRTRHRDLAEKFHGVSTIMAEGDSTKNDSAAFDDQSAAETTNNTTAYSVRKIQEVLKNQPACSSPRSLMKVLDDYKRCRVKARAAHVDLLPPRSRNSEQSLVPSISRDVSSVKPCNSGENTDKNIVNKPVLRGNGTVSKTPSATLSNCGQSYKQDKASREEELSCRPQSSERSASALSTNVGGRCPSQLGSDPTRRSVLYIPQLEVAFGFVAIGDTAVSNVDVTNRTDNSLRIRAKLCHTGLPFTLLDSQIVLLDAHRSTSLRIEFSPNQNARYYTNLLIAVEGGGGPQVNYRMPVRGLGGTAVVTVKPRDDLRLSRNGTYILQSCYESTFSFALNNSGNRRAFSRVVVLCATESGVLERIPVDVRPAPGIVIDRGESKQVSIRLRSPIPNSDWRSSQNSIVSTTSTTQQRAASQLQVIVYWGEERTRQRLRCFENLKGISHYCEGIRFTDAFIGEDLTFCPPEDHPITKEDVRLFDQTLRMCTIYVCSPRIRPRPSLISNPSSFERSLQPEDTFRERSTYKVAVPDQTLR